MDKRQTPQNQNPPVRRPQAGGNVRPGNTAGSGAPRPAIRNTNAPQNPQNRTMGAGGRPTPPRRPAPGGPSRPPQPQNRRPAPNPSGKTPTSVAEQKRQNVSHNEKTQYAAPKKRFSFKNISLKNISFFHWLSSRKKNILENEKKRDEIPENLIRVRGGIDRPMLIIILLLLCYGSIMVFSASYAFALSDAGDSYYYIRRQIIFVAIGLVAMVCASLFDYKTIQKFTPLVFVGCLGLMGAVLVTGISRGDAQRWIYIGPISIQASEPMKLGLVLGLSWYYHKMDRYVRTKLFWRSSLFGTFIPMLIVGVVCLLIILENHFSGTIIMFAIGMLVIFAAGGRLTWFCAGGAAFAGIVTALIFATEYASQRIDVWLHPENYSTQGEVWQTLQGLYAIGSGGIWGVGLGNSTQKHLFVSEPQNDFIYSIICEELGLFGAVLVISLFVAFVWRGIKIAQNTPDTFSRLVAVGIVSQIGIQAFLNIAVVTGTIPNTGITLPFFSYGGSSLTILLVEMGILLGISRYSYQQK